MEATLRQPTSWGAALHRTARGKAWHRGLGKNASWQPSYVEASLVDFELCRRADWLIGWCGSTFSRLLAQLRGLDRRSAEWYSACPESMHALSTRAVLYQWNLCNSTEDEAAHDKLGYKRSPEALEAYSVARHFELGTHTKAGRAEAFAVRSAWKESIGLHVRY